MEKLMLSADGDIMLYEVGKNIIKDLENILDQFYKWKQTNCYDEQLFVKFIQETYGDGSIRLIKNLGWFDRDNIPEEYKNIEWHNF